MNEEALQEESKSLPAENVENEGPERLSQIVALNTICKIKGKSGLWVPTRQIKAKRKLVFQFMGLTDPKLRTTTFSHADVQVLGYDSKIVAAFDTAHMMKMPIHDVLSGWKDKNGDPYFKAGEVKKYAKCYQEIETFLTLSESGELLDKYAEE